MKFECEVSGNFLEYQESLDCIQLINSYIDPNAPKLFCKLLRDSIDYYKKNNYIKLFQLITKKEWEGFINKNTKWQYIRNYLIEDNECVMISCNIDDAVECIASGYGL